MVCFLRCFYRGYPRGCGRSGREEAAGRSRESILRDWTEICPGTASARHRERPRMMDSGCNGNKLDRGNEGPTTRMERNVEGMESIARHTRRGAYGETAPKCPERREFTAQTWVSRQMAAGELPQERMKKGYLRYSASNFVAPRLTQRKQTGVPAGTGKRRHPLMGRTAAVWTKTEGMNQDAAGRKNPVSQRVSSDSGAN